MSAFNSTSYRWRLENPGEDIPDPWIVIGGHQDPQGHEWVEFSNGKCISRQMYEAVLQNGPLPSDGGLL